MKQQYDNNSIEPKYFQVTNSIEIVCHANIHAGITNSPIEKSPEGFETFGTFLLFTVC